MGEEPCNTGLALGLWGAADVLASPNRKRQREPVQFHILFPPCAKEEEGEEQARPAGENEARSRLVPRAAVEVEDAPERKAQGVGDGGGGARKKLRLTKEQSSLLEGSFRENSTLTPTQKRELAGRLNLRPRQVEVWFQNRRARTKLRQTEEDCEFLKKCCESLSDENRRLKEELQELRTSLRNGWSFHPHLPRAAVQAMCPSCERSTAASGKGAGPGGIAAPAGMPSWFYSSAIKDSSMAC